MKNKNSVFELKIACFLSAIMSLLSEFIVRTDMKLNYLGVISQTQSSGELRSWIYIILMYILAIPILILCLRSNLFYNHNLPNHSLQKRLKLTLLSLVILPVLSFFPLIFMLIGEDDYRIGGIYYLFTTSFLGLLVIGSLLFYAASLGIYLFMLIPKLLIGNESV